MTPLCREFGSIIISNHTRNKQISSILQEFRFLYFKVPSSLNTGQIFSWIGWRHLKFVCSETCIVIMLQGFRVYEVVIIMTPRIPGNAYHKSHLFRWRAQRLSVGHFPSMPPSPRFTQAICGPGHARTFQDFSGVAWEVLHHYPLWLWLLPCQSLIGNLKPPN